MPEGVVGLGRVQVRRPISASSAIAASSRRAGRAPLQTWPRAKVGTWTRRNETDADTHTQKIHHRACRDDVGVALSVTYRQHYFS